MSNDLMVLSNDDGWADEAAEAAERVIKGTLLKFADGQWSKGKEATAVTAGTQLVAHGVARGWVKWWDSKPTEYRMQEPGTRLPDREELPDQDENEWQLGPDEKTKRDPWQSTKFVYLIDPMTAEAFTFSTSSWGGRNSVSDLSEQIGRMRSAHPGAVPVVELQSIAQITKFGRKSKPWFKVVGWRKNGGDEAPPLLIENKDGSSSGNNKAAETAKVLNDELPW